MPTSIEVNGERILSAQAEQTFTETYPQYPKESIQVTDGPCPSGGRCWVISGHKNIETEEGDLPAYSFIDGTVIYVDAQGNIVQALETN